MNKPSSYRRSILHLRENLQEIRQDLQTLHDTVRVQSHSVSQKNPPPRNFLTFFPKRLEILVQILHAY